MPDLVTVLVAQRADGRLDAEFIGDRSLPRASGGYSDMDGLVSAVETSALELYRSSPTESPAPMGFQYAWYPWGDDKKSLKLPGGPTQFLVFEIRQSAGGYQAWLDTDPTISTVMPRLADLPPAIGKQALERWPMLSVRTIPGMLHWNRELTTVGFRDAPEPGSS